MTISSQPWPDPRSSRRSRIAAAATVAASAAVVAVTIAGCGGSRSRTTRSAQTSSTTQTSSHKATSRSGSSTPSTGATPPPTTVNSSCKPPPQRPDPVVLVPGTYGATSTSWRLIGPQLAQLGYCVYTFTYGNDETGPIGASAHLLARWVDRLLRRTGASRVAIVGHSEGGMMPRYYVKFLGGASKVDRLVALAPSNHGTLNPATFGGELAGCAACAQQQTGSSFLTQLNAGSEAPAPVDYTVIETVYDEVVIPYTSAFLIGPSARVTNVTLQQACPGDVVGHLGITTDPVALQWVENALASNGPADRQFAPSC